MKACAVSGPWVGPCSLVCILTLVLGCPHAMGFEAEPYVAEALESGGGWLTRARWAPYLVGAGIGVLSWLAFLLSDHPLGVSTAYARTAGMVEKAVRGEKVKEKEYYQEHEPVVDWEWMLVLGLLVGATASAVLSGDFRWEVVPPMWEGGFGYSPVVRIAVAVLGGWLIGFGARWAGGCTSGHGISGALQLVISSWLAALCFFIGGIAAAFLLYRVFA